MSNEHRQPELVYSNDGELYQYDSLQELICDQGLQPGDVVHEGELQRLSASAYIDAENVIERMADRASEIAGEASDGFPYVNKAARSKLEKLLGEWADQHISVGFNPVANPRERQITQDDIDAI